MWNQIFPSCGVEYVPIPAENTKLRRGIFRLWNGKYWRQTNHEEIHGIQRKVFFLAEQGWKQWMNWNVSSYFKISLSLVNSASGHFRSLLRSRSLLPLSITELGQTLCLDWSRLAWRWIALLTPIDKMPIFSFRLIYTCNIIVRYHCGGRPEEVNTCFLNSYMVYL